jgi:actin-related protein
VNLGFSKRFQNELAIATKRPDISIIPDPNVRERGYNSQRRIAAWVGGSIFGSLSTFRDIHITKQEWEEYHEAILDRKCF